MSFNQPGSQDSGPLKIRLTRALYTLSYNHTLCKDLPKKVTPCSLVLEILLTYQRQKLGNTWRPTIRPSFSVYQQI